MKKLLLALITLAMVFSLVGCSGGSEGGNETAEEMVYVVAQDGEPSSMNPDATSDDFFYAIAQNLYPRLVKLTNNYEAVLDLAEDWTCTDGGMTYTFKLRDNAVWTDGEKVTANDVKYTYDTIISESYANASVFTFVESIEVVDELTVVFHMSSPDASFISNVAWYGCFVLPQHVLEGTDWIENTDFSEAPVTCGPFKFESWTKGQNVTIVRDENYFGDTALLDKVIYTVIPDTATQYQAWLNGEVDEIGQVPASELASLMERDDLTWVKQVWPSPYYVTFNMKDGVFADPVARLAVAKAINRDDVSEKAFAGMSPANNYYIPEVFADALNPDAKQPDYDLEGAIALLEEAGYTKNENGYYIETEFTIFSGFEDAAYVVIDNLEKAGIHCTLNVIDYNIWEEQVWGNQEFTITMVAGFQGPDVLGPTRRWTADGTVNVNGYSRPEIEELYQKMLVATSTEEMNELMKEIQVYLAEDITIITMVSYTDNAPYWSYIKGHPYYSDEQGGSRAKAGFSELTYVYIEK